MALPKLQELMSQGRLEDSYPELNLNDLQNHVKRTGQIRHERERDWRTATEGHVARTGGQLRKAEVHLSESEKVRHRGARRATQVPPLLREREEREQAHLEET